MMLNKEANKIVNDIGVNEKKEMFKHGVHVEHFWVRVLKEMLWKFVVEMGRGGCLICTCISPGF